MRKKLGKSLFYLSILELFFKICTSLQVFVLLGSQPSTTNGETSFHHCWFCPLYNIFLIYGECIRWCSMWIIKVSSLCLFIFSFPTKCGYNFYTWLNHLIVFFFFSLSFEKLVLMIYLLLVWLLLWEQLAFFFLNFSYGITKSSRCSILSSWYFYRCYHFPGLQKVWLC